MPSSHWKNAGCLEKGWDDELEFNTQSSSQWDSLCHFLHQETGSAYNGAKPTKELLNVSTTSENVLPTADHWHARGGIVGRGVLIDFKSYIEATTGKAFSPLDGHRITVQEVEAVARHQGLEFKPGDIMIIRTGYTEAIANPTPGLFAKFHQGGGLAGFAWRRRDGTVGLEQAAGCCGWRRSRVRSVSSAQA